MRYSVYKKKNKTRKKIILGILICTILGIGATVLNTFAFTKSNDKKDNFSTTSKILDSSKNEGDKENVSNENKNINNGDNKTGETDESDKTDSIDKDKTDKTDNIDKENTLEYDYSKPVPKGEIVDNAYFDDAVFIGNSRTQGFILSNKLSNAKALTSKGLMVDTVFTKKLINLNGKKSTIIEALDVSKFDKIYIMLGINELGWVYTDVFIEKYSAIVDHILTLNKDAKIYIQSILPVSEEKSTNDKIYNNENINKFNTLLKKMCEDKNIYYVNVKEAVEDDNGNLLKEASLDGVHFNKEYCEKWYEYLKVHAL
ncbi:hypothetical protein JYG23_05340 [Sedimentibacter sp. zth1]|uniref:GDSL-type esterase/lipase family protein n=1 Tax=Sedimentibacter sp. zth1 TaxID=2816908 RepID=UPI001A91B574|nr:GDSL-type esterase/lipase family protein [Sedimentibacter sp. zth1]QSX06872.1 hypothetical protein JYG23_05340 [Sedimentibacter sp. zth1]